MLLFEFTGAIDLIEAFLEEDEALEAEIFVNKASIYMNAVTDWALQLRYRVTAARVMDANRKFIDAAVRYYELSTTSHGNVSSFFGPRSLHLLLNLQTGQSKRSS